MDWTPGSKQLRRGVLVKISAIWPASELVLGVIFITAFIAWLAFTAPMRKCLSTCQCGCSADEEERLGALFYFLNLFFLFLTTKMFCS